MSSHHRHKASRKQSMRHTSMDCAMLSDESSLSSSSDDDVELDEAGRKAKQEARTKRRKAKNQRRYYRRNKVDQQAKGRARTSKNRALAKMMREPKTDEDDEPELDMNQTLPSSPPTLVPAPLAAVQRCTRAHTPLNSIGTANTVGTNYSSVTYLAISEHQLPPNEDNPADDFVIRSARARMAFIRRALLQVEDELGAIDRWPVAFSQEWAAMQMSGPREVTAWFESIRGKAQTGRRIISYFGRVMDGEMPSVDEWRNLWLEAYQLLGTVYTGVLGLEQRLEFTELYYRSDRLQS